MYTKTSLSLSFPLDVLDRWGLLDTRPPTQYKHALEEARPSHCVPLSFVSRHTGPDWGSFRLHQGQAPRAHPGPLTKPDSKYLLAQNLLAQSLHSSPWTVDWDCAFPILLQPRYHPILPLESLLYPTNGPPPPGLFCCFLLPGLELPQLPPGNPVLWPDSIPHHPSNTNAWKTLSPIWKALTDSPSG